MINLENKKIVWVSPVALASFNAARGLDELPIPSF